MPGPVLNAGFPPVLCQTLRRARLPGIRPAAPDSWLTQDDAFAGQMALRDRLIAERFEAVHALLPDAGPAAAELYRTAMALLATRPGYRRTAEAMTRPDGVRVPLTPARPLATLGRLVQEDLCLMLPGPQGHRLMAAILCFPASWTLAEKIGKALLAVHRPVAEYDADLTRRVQRLFDAIRPEAPLERGNLLAYARPDLFQPKREADPRSGIAAGAPYLRAERQCLLRLPETGAVVFSIHTYVVRRAALDAAHRAEIEALMAARGAV